MVSWICLSLCVDIHYYYPYCFIVPDHYFADAVAEVLMVLTLVFSQMWRHSRHWQRLSNFWSLTHLRVSDCPSNTELQAATGEKPVTLEIIMSKWRWIGMRREPEGEEDRSKPGKGPFWMEQANGGEMWSEVKRLAGNSQMQILYECSALLMERRVILRLSRLKYRRLFDLHSKPPPSFLPPRLYHKYFLRELQPQNCHISSKILIVFAVSFRFKPSFIE